MANLTGIDLGTTFSAVAIINQNGFPEIIPDNASASDFIPSAVFYPESGGTVIGQNAKEAAVEYPDRVFQFFKRWMARTEDADCPPMELDGRILNPIELSAAVLKKICEYSGDAGYPITDAVITVPAYFTPEQREATKAAGKNAGINVLATINEPTAAALCYCYGQLNENRKVLVYDLGGGTFDVTLMDMTVDADGFMGAKVICTDGVDKLGGKDWDEEMTRILVEKFSAASGTEQPELDVVNQLRGLAEKTKQLLTNMPTANAKITADGEKYKLSVSREEFDNRTASLLQQSMNKVEAILEKAAEMGCSEDQIDLVLLVGGSTIMPQVQDALKNRFPGKVQFFDPNKAVAKGAAIACKYIQDGRDITQMTEMCGKLNLTGEVTVKKNDEGGFDITDENGSKVTINKNDISDSVKEKLEKAEEAGPVLGTELIAPTGGGIEIGDLVPGTFGVIVRKGNGYICRNHVMKDMQTPCRGERTYGAPGGDRIHLLLPVVQSVSENEEDPVIRRDGQDENGNRYPIYEFPDTALQMKLVAQLELITTPGLQPGEPVEVIVNYDELANLSVSMRVVSTGEEKKQNVNFAIVSEAEMRSIAERIENMEIIDDV